MASANRLRLAREAAELRARGLSVREVAETMEISRSHASALLSDPDGSKERARKDSYRGTCETCGAATDGSNGAAAAPRFCHLCIPDAVRIWTKETVIDAIQRFATINGRPPLVSEWILTDFEMGYPARSSVYSQPGAPFASWADAIEAAGFERPRVGKREGDHHWDSPDDVLAWIRENSVDGVAPSSLDNRAGRPARIFFGSWEAACEAAGVKARSAIKRWTAEKVVGEIRALTISGYPPRSNEDFNLHAAARRIFGAWNAAVRAAGFEPYLSYDLVRIRKRRDLVARREARRSARRPRAASRAA